ncbi:MAG: hypothetical protein QHJ34_03545 [bacterium]|jgi:hypothetical protein|nr:hypothetical protein [candidate division KSB1 bacterium]MDH7559288.1 hypothetical protein [bacterium]
MRTWRINKLAFFCWSLVAAWGASWAWAQEGDLSLRIAGSVHSQSEASRAERAAGIGSDLQMLFRLWGGLHVKVGAGYDYLWLRQRDVLDEWHWDYWEKTYIDFLPGAKVQHVNQTLRYTSADSIYSAVFHPSQQLKELRLLVGVEQVVPLTRRWNLGAAGAVGVDFFYRELEMREDWTKRFNVDTTSADLDYAFHYRLLHFAPTRKGASVFVAPSLGVRVAASSAVDIGWEVAYVHYLRGERTLGVRLSEDGSRWLPLRGKLMCSLGVTFKY